MNSRYAALPGQPPTGRDAPDTPPTPTSTYVTKQPSTFTRWRWLTVIAVVGLFIAGGSVLYLRNRPAPPRSPFSASTLAALQFPLYYPTKLPSGYRIDAKSVSLPQAGVVVFTMDDNHGHKLYMSQESRPSTFNFGGYYNDFEDKQLTVIGTGTIAVGRINNGTTEIASLATNKTWVLANTTTSIPLVQLRDMLKSLAASH